LKLIFGFIGITDIDFIHADSLALGDNARNQAIANARSVLKTKVFH
jgi:FMN-dependent NADH-azoreductase